MYLNIKSLFNQKFPKIGSMTPVLSLNVIVTIWLNVKNIQVQTVKWKNSIFVCVHFQLNSIVHIWKAPNTVIIPYVDSYRHSIHNDFQLPVKSRHFLDDVTH